MISRNTLVSFISCMLLISLALTLSVIDVKNNKNTEEKGNNISEAPIDLSITKVRGDVNLEFNKISDIFYNNNSEIMLSHIKSLPSVMEEEPELEVVDEIPLAIDEPARCADLTLDYFETNRCMYTIYGENSKYARGCASPYRDQLISIDEDTKQVELPNGEKVFVHSIATNHRLLPYESIIYIPKLGKYFIVDDNADASYKLSNGTVVNLQNYQTEKAWNSGCSIWIDIFLGYSTGYREGGNYNKTEVLNNTGISSGKGTFEFELIRYGKG